MKSDNSSPSRKPISDTSLIGIPVLLFSLGLAIVYNSWLAVATLAVLLILTRYSLWVQKQGERHDYKPYEWIGTAGVIAVIVILAMMTGAIFIH